MDRDKKMNRSSSGLIPTEQKDESVLARYEMPESVRDEKSKVLDACKLGNMSFAQLGIKEIRPKCMHEYEYEALLFCRKRTKVVHC
jgi:hypothetical protein